MPGYPWYTNDEIELQIKPNMQIPDGFHKGRLPRSEESKRKQSQSLMGHPGYWQGKKMPPDSRGETIKQQFANGKVQWNTGLTKETDERIAKMANKKLGKSAWNKGLTAETDERVAKYVSKWHDGTALKKSNETKHKNNSFHISKQEDAYYLQLINEYGEDNVKRQYSDSRYPFACDFYIPSEDLFIEFNRNWTHGGHPFDENNLDDIYKFEQWQEKAETSAYYKNAIYTWTDLDVRKQKCAKENNLNYKMIY